MSAIDFRLRRARRVLRCIQLAYRTASYFNALSLDAVAVALVWQALFAIEFTGSVPRVFESIALALTVWLVYCGDRLLDGNKIDLSKPSSFRHRFHVDHRHKLVCVWVVLLMVDAVIASTLIDEVNRVRGVLVGAAVLGYQAIVHGLDDPDSMISRWFPKELIVGFLFALGTTLATWPAQFFMDINFLASLMLSAFVFAVNCLVVSSSEATTDYEHGFIAMPRNWQRVDRTLNAWIATAAVACLTGILTGLVPQLISISLLISSLLMGCLASISKRSEPSRSVGLLADLALIAAPIAVIAVSLSRLVA